MALTEMPDRIDSDEKGRLDDVVIENVAMFHVEWMDDKTVWMRCYKSTGRYSGDDVVFWLTIEKGKIVYEYYAGGTLKRVEFFAPNDYAPSVLGSINPRASLSGT